MSIHVVDVTRGVIAAGLRVEVHVGDPPRLLCDGSITATGTLDAAVLSARLDAGTYEARFHVADFYRRSGIALPAVPFLGVAVFRFGIDDPAQHYHLPMKLSPWGLSCFRGGA
jgi:5-hydroxyisourate hydrolase